MRLRRTAAGAIVVLVLAGCGSGGGNAAVTTLAETTTTTEAPTTTSVVATTTTVAPATTEAPPAATTTVVQDATTADPKVLARQLQAVLDRYEALVMRSRSDPNLPFTDEGLISDLRKVATGDFLGVFWVPKWQAARDDGLAAGPGPAGDRRVLVNSVDVVDGGAVTVGYCYYDDG